MSNDEQVTHPVTGHVGWEDINGNIWSPTGEGKLAYGGPHWDVVRPDGKMYTNVYPANPNEEE